MEDDDGGIDGGDEDDDDGGIDGGVDEDDDGDGGDGGGMYYAVS